MSRLGTTDVGEMFGKAPSRASGLTGTLAPRPRLVSPEADSASPATNAESEIERDVGGETTPEPRTTHPKKSAGSEPIQARDESATSRRLVVVYVSQEDSDWVTLQRKTTDRTNAQVVLAAIESTATRLAAEFTAAAPRPSGMFSTPTTPIERHNERHVQLGLSGILPSDREVLDRLVNDTGAGSLSALVRAALRLHRQADAESVVR